MTATATPLPEKEPEERLTELEKEQRERTNTSGHDDVTAEGVENAAQHEFLKVAGCDRLQGFYFSQPVSAAALTAFLNTRHAVAA